MKPIVIFLFVVSGQSGGAIICRGTQSRERFANVDDEFPGKPPALGFGSGTPVILLKYTASRMGRAAKKCRNSSCYARYGTTPSKTHSHPLFPSLSLLGACVERERTKENDRREREKARKKNDEREHRLKRERERRRNTTQKGRVTRGSDDVKRADEGIRRRAEKG